MTVQKRLFAAAKKFWGKFLSSFTKVSAKLFLSILKRQGSIIISHLSTTNNFSVTLGNYWGGNRNCRLGREISIALELRNWRIAQFL